MVTSIHILAIDGVSHRLIHDPVNVLENARRFFEESEDYEIIHINSLDRLDELIREPPEDLILFNAHGETIPIPPSWENPQEYLRQISNNIYVHGWVLVSICGMPVWCYSSGNNEEEFTWNGLNILLEPVGARVNEQMLFGWFNLTTLGKNVSSRNGETLPNLLQCSRGLSFSNLSLISKSLYRIGDFSGASAIKIGKGYLLHSGILPSNITPPTDHTSLITDNFMALLSLLLTIGLLDSTTNAEEIFETAKDNENSIRKKVIIPLLRLKGFKNVTDIHGSDEHGRDIVCYLNDGFGNRINFAFQIKAREIHCNTNREPTSHITTITTQIQDAFTTPINDPLTNNEQHIHIMYIVTSKNISAEAKRTIVRGTYNFHTHVHFVDGGQLKQEWLKFYNF